MTPPRSARLVRLIERLARSTTPATRAVLCAELQISPRLLADDIGGLIAEGTPVIGDARRD